MKRIIFSIVVCLLPLSAMAAEMVKVRTGEHGLFTRIVLEVPANTEWKLDKAENGHVLTLPGLDALFNLEDAFSRISRNRLIALVPVPDQPALNLQIDCDCQVAGYFHNARLLVIDVRDGPPGESVASPAPDQAKAPEMDKTGESSTRTLEYAALPLIGPPVAAPFHLGFGVTLEEAAVPKVAPEAADAADLDRIRRVKEAEMRLLEQIGRAATQGLLSPAASARVNAKPPEEEVAMQTPPPEQTEEPPLNDGMAHVNLKAETSMDRDLMQLLGVVPQTGNGRACLPDSELVVAEWGGDSPFNSQLGYWRSRLVGEFDRIDPEAVYGLAQLYLHAGFGAEASQTLSMIDENQPRKSVLAVLAEIVDRGYATRPGPLERQLDCDSAVALWSVLANRELPSVSQVNTAAVLRTFSALPLHLRIHLGPVLSNRLLSGGEIQAAKSVLRITERGVDAPDSGMAHATAQLDLAEGKTGEAASELSKVVAANTELSPAALIDLIDTNLDRGEAISPETAELAGAFAQEQRDQPAENELRRVYVLALADAGRFAAGFKEIAGYARTSDTAHAADLTSRVLQILTDKADDLTFLEHAIAQTHNEAMPIARDVANHVAGRLIDLGFTDPAVPYLETAGGG